MHALLVTQDNVTVPLDEYSAYALPCEADDFEGFQGSRRENYLTFGTTLIAIARSFCPTSRFWRIPPSYDGHPTFRYQAASTGAVTLKSKRLRAWESISERGNRKMAWEEAESNILSSGVLRLVRAAKLRNPRPS
jgi:hypothetical protein